ncbi:unnamed protein product [Miscanthus lutarioriparius]|uniref:Uncharacterized protein n=1 Tax=Miscanthus lutarioriparius TaxID=422564 RepID=A0A811Q8I4_9POAL|nr:unnamed protein product [Miscanthus lutarioriparius]
MPTGETLKAGTQSESPVPPPPPTPTATASSSPASTRQRRHRTFSSSSSSSSSSLSTVSSAASSPSLSPRGRGTTTTSVPFSWEHHPGIPKTRLIPAGTPSSAPTPLPLPPPLRAPPTTTSRPRHQQHARRRRSRGNPPPADDAADPFAAALVECTRERGAGAGSDDAGLMDALFPARAPPAPTSRRWSIASAGGVVGLLDLYGCKSAMGGVAEGAFVARRPVAVVRAGPGRAGRR